MFVVLYDSGVREAWPALTWVRVCGTAHCTLHSRSRNNTSEETPLHRILPLAASTVDLPRQHLHVLYCHAGPPHKPLDRHERSKQGKGWWGCSTSCVAPLLVIQSGNTQPRPGNVIELACATLPCLQIDWNQRMAKQRISKYALELGSTGGTPPDVPQRLLAVDRAAAAALQAAAAHAEGGPGQAAGQEAADNAGAPAEPPRGQGSAAEQRNQSFRDTTGVFVRSKTAYITRELLSLPPEELSERLVQDLDSHCQNIHAVRHHLVVAARVLQVGGKGDKGLGNTKPGAGYTLPL